MYPIIESSSKMFAMIHGCRPVTPCVLLQLLARCLDALFVEGLVLLVLTCNRERLFL